ncbi:YkgJ family cysteine cluster protein, partial [Agathobaculum butyriciproducens]|nr:YkgJ family cysteine cluster protein [Agathobaculum butyriciproducens]
MSLEDEFFIKWQQTIVELGQFFREAEKTASERIMELSWTAAFIGLYLHYDVDQDFMPQFEKNA